MLETHQLETDKRLDEVLKRIDTALPPVQGIFFDGQVFDAYTFVNDLIRSAKKQIILFDNFIDDSVLVILDKRKEGVSAQIYTRSITPQLALDISRLTSPAMMHSIPPSLSASSKTLMTVSSALTKQCTILEPR